MSVDGSAVGDRTQHSLRAPRARRGPPFTLLAVTGTLVVGCSSPGGASSTPATASPAQVTVTSTLAGRSTLPLRILWEALPSVPATQVIEVDFRIDDSGPVWVDRSPPYVYGSAGNWLVTSFLTPGKHRFTVGVITLGSQEAVSTVTATVAAPPSPPDGLGGTWVRTVTAADAKKANLGPPPSGDWHLTIDPAGWYVLDPQTNGELFDVGYASSSVVLMRPTIEHPPTSRYPNSGGGGFCAAVDPVFSWTVAIGGAGKTLTLHPQGLDPCGDRVAVLEGVWTLINAP
jgi:hypothetical protein